MVSFPNCKINLGLNIVSKRPDGYHNLETIFYPINIKDALEIIPSTDSNCNVSGINIHGASDDNLCIKAYRLLKADFPHLPSISIHLHKAIPIGAGLGGGSADGAFMLTMLNKKFDLNISKDKLIEYALHLGSDCPFFIINKPCFATGRGEVLETIAVDLSAYKIILINPGIHISTKEAFSSLTPSKPSTSIKKIISTPVGMWRDLLINDFEKTVFPVYPEIAEIKRTLYESGATYASMTGTGSTVYGVFENKIPDFSFPKNYFVISV